VKEESLEPKKVAIRRSGELAEKKVKRVLLQLKREGKIKGFEQTRRFSPEDLRGIDFKIYPKNFSEKESVLLQVKSRLNKKEVTRLGLIKIELNIWFKDGIFTIEAKPKEKEGQIKYKILKILERS
jgi:hypothetical protein